MSPLTRSVVWSRVRVEALGSGAPRFGILVTHEARSLVALGATSEAELDEQLDACGGPVGYARRFGAEPLDPEGIAAGPQGELVFMAPP